MPQIATPRGCPDHPRVVRPDIETRVAGARKWVDAGFIHLALAQVGGSMRRTFIHWAERELLPALREL